MPNTNNPLPIRCPKCHHGGGKLVAESLSVLTVTCASCHHTWATDLSVLSPEIQQKIHVAVRNI
jgi:hypothetical protein